MSEEEEEEVAGEVARGRVIVLEYVEEGGEGGEAGHHCSTRGTGEGRGWEGRKEGEEGKEGGNRDEGEETG